MFKKIVDKHGQRVTYENLNKNEKESVLAELLLQTALHSIAERRIVI